MKRIACFLLLIISLDCLSAMPRKTPFPPHFPKYPLNGLFSDWMYENTTTSSKSHENPAALYVSPILQAEYIRRGLIRE